LPPPVDEAGGAIGGGRLGADGKTSSAFSCIIFLFFFLLQTTRPAHIAITPAARAPARR